MSVVTIKSGIETRCQAVLGSSYQPLSYVLNVEKNNFKGNTNRFGVIGGSLEQNEGRGCTGRYTVDQTFTIKFTDSFGQKPTSDTAIVDTMDSMMDNALLLYKDLVNTNAGTPSIVIMVSDLSIDAPETVDNIVVVTMNVTITYRKAL